MSLTLDIGDIESLDLVDASLDQLLRMPPRALVPSPG